MNSFPGATLNCLNLVISGCPRNVEKFTKAPPPFTDSMKSLDLLPDPQHFTNSIRVAKRSPPSLSCLRFFVFLNILSLCLKIADLKPLTSDTTTHAAAQQHVLSSEWVQRWKLKKVKVKVEFKTNMLKEFGHLLSHW